MKVLLATLVVGLVGCCQVPPAQIPDERSLLRDLTARTVKVEAICAGGNGHGSGVILSANAVDGMLIATAEHVVANKDCEYMVGAHFAEILYTDEKADTALLRVPTEYHHPRLDIAHHEYLGQPVIVLGHPIQGKTLRQAGFQITRGHIIIKLKDRIRVSASSWFGGSGGPVFNEQGELIGLMVSGTFSMEGYPINDSFLITPAKTAYDMLACLKRDCKW